MAAAIRLPRRPRRSARPNRRILTPTVADVLDRFITDHAREHLKDKTAGEYERIVAKILKPKVGEVKIDALAPKDVAEMYHAMRSMRPAGPNPASTRLEGTRRRQRLFSDTEVGRLLKTIDTLEA
jgi:uncharacterized protein with von Willebrand factor type A (vWA) domain